VCRVDFVFFIGMIFGRAISEGDLDELKDHGVIFFDYKVGIVDISGRYRSVATEGCFSGLGTIHQGTLETGMDGSFSF
jgi:hypothetical protein